MAVETGVVAQSKLQKILSEESGLYSQDPSGALSQPAPEDVQNFQKILEDDNQPQLNVISPSYHTQAIEPSVQTENIVPVEEVHEVEQIDLPTDVQDREIAINNSSQMVADLNTGVITPVELLRLQKVVGVVQTQAVTTTQVSQQVEQNISTFLKE
ncbi:hypothetical protein K9U34_06375 [Lawsonia intracellularis]|nr:hypothetical protein [Lawsonia intracellularis]AGC50594.1 hypothetical protein LAW_01199 [Lawsonia intracellularis N343]KAA0204891.1 hypothetical protein C4K43_00040 [Lawsonia intracellularis]MBZ3893218.1 hypothetical protein [Lawsonia intracellularis]RBN32560.1 hypothetical protein DR194_06335 [Lawsonia intracellularis]RBN34123.1 hypothetical protein DR192_06340 [Lawsonia intracellularis]